MIKQIAFTTFLAAAFCQELNASIYEKYGWGMSLGAVSSKESGVNFAASYDFKFDKLIARWNFIDVNSYSKDPEGYREERTSSGNTICRDESNGRFAEDEKCNPVDLDIGSTIDINYVLGEKHAPHMVGIGMRAFGDSEYGDSVTPYLTGSFHFNDSFGVFARLGSNYNQLSLAYWF